MNIKPDYTIFLTNRCILQCKHCYWDESLKKQTLSKGNLEKILINLPKGYFNLTFTGGEIMLERDLLFAGLKLLKKIRKKENMLNITLQSTGYWLEDDRFTYTLFKDFYKLCVDNIEFPSADKFHREAGFDIDKKKKIINKLKIMGEFLLYLFLEQLMNQF